MLRFASESFTFKAHLVEKNADGSSVETDTITGYRQYHYKSGIIQMEGKVTKTDPKPYRDGIWRYNNEAGQLMRVDTYSKEGMINRYEFMYFTNGKPMSETYQYYEGDYKVKESIRFHKIETLFYTNGQALAERHWVNNGLVEAKCWDSKGNPKPIEYLETVKSVEGKEN